MNPKDLVPKSLPGDIVLTSAHFEYGVQVSVMQVSKESAEGFALIARAQTTEPLTSALRYTVGLPLFAIVAMLGLSKALGFSDNVTIAAIAAAACVSIPTAAMLRGPLEQIITKKLGGGPNGPAA